MRPNDLEPQEFARRIRVHALHMVFKARSSHIGSCLSMADILAVLYGRTLRVDPKHPDWPNRDRLIMSKGHAAAVTYAAVAEAGFMPVREFSLQGGTYNDRRISADVNQPLGQPHRWFTDPSFSDTPGWSYSVMPDGSPVTTADTKRYVDLTLNFSNSTMTTPFVMDTGSTGIAASKDFYTPSPTDVYLGPGSITYTSSNLIEVGSKYLTHVVIQGVGGQTITATVPILQVLYECSTSNPTCTNPPGKTIAYMGIGFDRGSARLQPETSLHSRGSHLMRARRIVPFGFSGIGSSVPPSASTLYVIQLQPM